MHFMVSFQIDADGIRRDEILKALEGCFGRQRFVRALDCTYVVQVPGYGVYEHLQLQLMEVARAQEELVQICQSPLITSGLYHGRMKKEIAGVLNSLTDE